jgi:hypothetical protein
MDFQLKDILQTAGPTAALVFASWMFLQLLTQKFTSTFSQYRALIAEYRSADVSDQRRQHLGEQIPVYKRRCEQMQRATVIGVVAAILLIFTLLAATVETIFGGDLPVLKYAGAAASVLGLSALLWAAVYLILENKSVVATVISEMKDLPSVSMRSGVHGFDGEDGGRGKP